jgi:ribosomal protein S18 acetylase RimI-like enzyme
MRDDYAALIAAGHVHVLDIAGAVEGVLVLIPEATAMLLDNVAVRAKGLGLGRTLLTFAEEQARAAGYTSIRLYTHEKMTENIELYRRLGYAETHRAEQRGLKRVFMAKPLPPA